jgi:hypothetical protein
MIDFLLSRKTLPIFSTILPSLLGQFSLNQTIREALKVIWENLFKLCEDFLGLVIGFRAKKGFAFSHGRRDMSSHDSVWAVTTQENMDTIVREKGWTAIKDV